MATSPALSSVNTLKGRFKDVLTRLQVNQGSVCLVGLSGGGDSVALVSLAADIVNLTIYAARVAHGMRSSCEDNAERTLCQKLCCQLRVQYADIVPPSQEIARLQDNLGCGPEQAARQVRLSLLEQHRQAIGADFILLGHTADDQLETILMRLMTASGPEGLKGIPMKRGKFLRPLITETREDLRLWLTGMGIQWAEDSTNKTGKYRRNRIRNELIPLISEIIPGWEMAALTLSERSMEVQDALEAVCQSSLPVEWKNREARWPVEQWELAPRYIKAMVLWKVLNRFDDSHIPDRRIPWNTVVDARRNLDTSGKWTGFDVAIHREDGYFVIKRCYAEAGQGRIVVAREDIASSLSERLGPWMICIEFSRGSETGGYPVSAEDWPLILTISGYIEKPDIIVSGRGQIITKKLAFTVFDNSENEIVYIRINKYEEG